MSIDTIMLIIILCFALNLGAFFGTILTKKR